MRQIQFKEEQVNRDQQNMLLHAYGYYWRRREELTEDQIQAVLELFVSLSHDGPDGDIPNWVLLSPLNMPVRKEAIFHWLGSYGPSGDDVLDFIAEHGFVPEGKDKHGVWRIRTPSGKETLNLKQTLQGLEMIRTDQARMQKKARVQKKEEEFVHSVQSLKEVLDLYGEAENEAPAWGYSPYPYVRRLSDKAILTRTYHFEGEWHEETFETPEQVVDHLYERGGWDSGAWGEPR